MLPHRAVSPAGERSRSKSRLPGRSLLPSTTLSVRLRTSALEDLRPVRASRLPFDARDPPDLGADFPDASRSLRPGREAGFPLLGLSKDRPSIVQVEESDSRSRSASRLRGPSLVLRDGKADSHPRAARVVLHHLDGLLLLDPATLFHAAADPGVHHVSFRRETEFPAMHLLPFEAFPPPTATVSGTNPGSRGPASPPRSSPVATVSSHDPLQPMRSPRTLPSRPFSPFLPPLRSPVASSGWKPGPQGLAPSSGPLPARPFPVGRARCSLGLVRFRCLLLPRPASRERETGAPRRARIKPALRQRPLREVASRSDPG